MNIHTHPLAPIVFEDSNTLILGSFPSLKSFKYGFYYAHAKNAFWPLLSELYGMKAQTKEERTTLLKHSKIALWDVIASCERTNSSDANLKNVTPNDIMGFLETYPNIKRLFFTGRTSEKLYRKHFSHLPFPTTLLPSPSPAYASMSFKEKLKIYKALLAS